MVETGKRDLQTDQYLRLSRLALAFNPLNSGVSAARSKTHTDHQKKLNDFAKKKLAEQQYKMTTCQRALTWIKRKHDQALRALESLTVLMAKPNDPDNRHYEIMEITARRVLEKTELAQFGLEMQIEGLRAKADFLNATIRKEG